MAGPQGWELKGDYGLCGKNASQCQARTAASLFVSQGKKNMFADCRRMQLLHLGKSMQRPTLVSHVRAGGPRHELAAYPSAMVCAGCGYAVGSEPHEGGGIVCLIGASH